MSPIDDRIKKVKVTELRAWAAGSLQLEAAVELLTSAVNGRLMDGPWIRHDATGVWFIPEIAYLEGGALSGGERRVLAVAVSLATSEFLVDLGEVITGLDGPALDAVLAALAHAGGRSS